MLKTWIDNKINLVYQCFTFNFKLDFIFKCAMILTEFIVCFAFSPKCSFMSEKLSEL